MSERDVLLATKLNVPGLRPDLVPRPRLDEGRGRGLVLACAPAGYGKTVLLAGWVRRAGDPAAWLSLDAGDNDPARFCRHAVAALDRARPGISERAGPLLGPPAPPSFEPAVTALINEVVGRPDAGQALLLGAAAGPMAAGSRQLMRRAWEDVAFLRALIGRSAEHHGTSGDRVVVAGVSNGRVHGPPDGARSRRGSEQAILPLPGRETRNAPHRHGGNAGA